MALPQIMYTKINYCLLPGKAQKQAELALVRRKLGILNEDNITVKFEIKVRILPHEIVF